MDERPQSAKLTNSSVEKAVAWSREHRISVDIQDQGSPGLWLRCWTNGKASWTYRHGRGGAKVGLGMWPGITLSQARDLAAHQREMVANGANPSQRRREAREALTVEKAVERFKLRHVPTLKASTQDEYNRLLDKRILPALGDLKVRDLDRATVARWHSGIPTGTRGQREANHALSVLSVLMGQAEEWGERPEGSNPCHHVHRYDEAVRQRFLRPEELGRLSKVLDDSPVADEIRLMILMGLRVGEVLALTWSMVDLKGRVLTLPAPVHKSGRKVGAKSLPLSLPACKLLKELPRPLGSDLVFLASRRQLEMAWASWRKKAKIPDVRLHDLRHTFGSWGAAKGVSLKVLAGLMGHAHTATTDRYAHLDLDPLRKATEVIGEALAEALRRPS